MRRTASPRRGPIAIAIAAVAFVAFATLLLTGCACQPLDQPNTEQGGIDATGTVQADLTPDATSTPGATSTPEATTPVEPTKPATPAIWPAKVATFKKSFKKAVWYPAYLPSGYKVESLDIMEMDPDTHTGLVCSIIYLNGEKVLQFAQGSPTDRKVDVVSAGKVPWGTDTADIMYQDPEDTSTPPMIIYSKGGTYIELQGDPSLAELKKIAASMVPVE
jgi:hypothetical protein